MSIAFALVLAFFLTICVIPVAMMVAVRVNLVDVPSSRKRHSSSVPLVGGISILAAFAATSFFIPTAGITATLLGWFTAVLVVGVADDYADISHRIRLLLHLLIVVGIALTDGIVINNVGAITGGSDITFAGFTAIVFTVVSVLGAVNAVNMSDGVDGLLSSLVLVSLLAVLMLTNSSGELFTPVTLSMLCGAVAAFLLFNCRIFVSRAKSFLGDAGSTTLGFILVYALIYHTQGRDAAFSPVVAGWILGLPLLDASAVIAKRLFKGASPFSADRSHLHHLLMDRGVSVNKTVSILFSLHLLMIVFAITVVSSRFQYTDALLFWGFLGLVSVRVLYGLRATSVAHEVLAGPTSPHSRPTRHLVNRPTRHLVKKPESKNSEVVA